MRLNRLITQCVVGMTDRGEDNTPKHVGFGANLDFIKCDPESSKPGNAGDFSNNFTGLAFYATLYS